MEGIEVEKKIKEEVGFLFGLNQKKIKLKIKNIIYKDVILQKILKLLTNTVPYHRITTNGHM